MPAIRPELIGTIDLDTKRKRTLPRGLRRSPSNSTRVPWGPLTSAEKQLPIMRRRWSERFRFEPQGPFLTTAQLEANLQQLVDELELELEQLDGAIDEAIQQARE